MTIAIPAPNLRNWTAVIRHRMPHGEIDVFHDLGCLEDLPEVIARSGHEIVSISITRPEDQRITAPWPLPGNHPET